VIAGATCNGAQGAVQGPAVEPRYFDVSPPARQVFREVFPASHQVFIFVIEGSLLISNETVTAHTMAVLGDGTDIEVSSSDQDSRF